MSGIIKGVKKSFSMQGRVFNGMLGFAETDNFVNALCARVICDLIKACAFIHERSLQHLSGADHKTVF